MRIDLFENKISAHVRARRNWATLRSCVKAYMCAMWLYTYAGIKLCAPGGDWAERDRRDFEDDFSDMCTPVLGSLNN